MCTVGRVCSTDQICAVGQMCAMRRMHEWDVVEEIIACCALHDTCLLSMHEAEGCSTKTLDESYQAVSLAEIKVHHRPTPHNFEPTNIV